jgi:hypothetical protein
VTGFCPALRLCVNTTRLTRGILVAAVLLAPAASHAQTKPLEVPVATPPTPLAKRIFVDVGLVGSSSSLAKNRNFQGYFIKFGEVGSTSVSYPKPSRTALAPALDLGGAFMVLPKLAVGINYNRVRYEDIAGLQTTVPHPVFMSTPATNSGSTGALTRQEAATTIFAGWMPALGPRMQLRLTGGAAIFAYSAEMVQSASYTQNANLVVPPLNTITIDGSVNQKATGNDLGFAVGADFTFFITRLLGISGGVRYSRGTVTLNPEPLSKVRQDIRVGSTQILVGVRVRFGG